MNKKKDKNNQSLNSDQNALVFKQQDPLILAKNLIGAERNLELIGFFSPTSKSKGRPKTTKKLEREERRNGQRVKTKVSIIPSVEYGRPITTDLDMYRAFFKILKDIYFKHGKIENPVGFRNEDLIKAMGKARHGRLTHEIRGWLSRMNGTLIKSEGWIYEKKNKRYLSNEVKIFDQIVVYGAEVEDGEKANQNFVWLSDWFLNNLNYGYIFLIDHEVYKSFRHPIAKCLYGMLWWGFYAIRQTGGKFYWKDYSDLCKFLDIREYRYESKILEKLSPAHEELIKSKVISNWQIERQVNGKNFNIKWWPGEVFETYYMSYKKLMGGEGQLAFNGIIEPKKVSQGVKEIKLADQLVKLFHFLIKGKNEYQPKEKELQRAQELIDKYQEEKAWFITKYAIKRIQETKYADKVEYFGAIVNYVDEALTELIQYKNREKEQNIQKGQEFTAKKKDYETWLKQTPEERVQYLLDLWLVNVKTFEKREPSEEEIKAKQAEYMKGLPSPEERQKKIFGRIIFKENTLELFE